MADNWSASTLTLASQGDWCEWTFTVPDTTARDHLNGDGFNAIFSIRGAYPAASTTGRLAVIVNDQWVKKLDNAQVSDGAWVSADRFQPIDDNGAAGGFRAVGVETTGITSSPYTFGYPIPSGITGPFVVGSNTIRIVNVQAARPVEIDFLYLATGTVTVPDFGDDSTAETPPAGFAGHADPNPDVFNLSGDHEWILKPATAATGTSALALLTPRKFCPHGTTFPSKVKLTDTGGTPLPGETVWVYDPAVPSLTSATTDSHGIAIIDLLSGDGGEYFYLGSHDWLPCTLAIAADDRVNCGGWHVGNVGSG